MQLSLLAVGHLPAESVAPLLGRLDKIEVLELDVPPRDAMTKHRAEFHRAVDAAANDWVLIVREREQLGEALADEIVRAMKEAKAWGFRVRTTPLYAGKPLRLGEDAGELRLFHRRHLLRHGEDLAVQGTVVRLERALEAVTFESVEAHRGYLARTAVPHSTVRRVLLFMRYARTLDANTLRYLWVEAAFDHGGR